MRLVGKVAPLGNPVVPLEDIQGQKGGWKLGKFGFVPGVNYNCWKIRLDSGAIAVVWSFDWSCRYARLQLLVQDNGLHVKLLFDPVPYGLDSTSDLLFPIYY